MALTRTSLAVGRGSHDRRYSSLPVPITTLTEDERMMKETGESVQLEQ